MPEDRPRIYLDNAATSWPKPESVYAAVADYMRHGGAPAGRGVYHEAVQADRLLRQARTAVARLLGTDNPQRVIFTHNGTDSLNLALHGLLRPGDHVVTSMAEHNSVLRPLGDLQRHRDVQVTRLPVDQCGFVDPDDVRRAIGPRTRLVALIHASNVTGALQPAFDVGMIARERGVLFLLDAAQTLGHVPIDVSSLPIDLLAAPGHKGLLGPLGTGVLYVGPGVEQCLESVRQGGTGTDSETDRQPTSLPEKYESGNHNLPGLVGLGAAAEYLSRLGVATIQAHEQQLAAQLVEALCRPGVRVYGPTGSRARVGVVSLRVAGYDPQELALVLDTTRRIQVRAGLHCAPGIHGVLGTLQLGGTLRISCGPFNTPEQIELVASTIGDLCRASPAPVS